LLYGNPMRSTSFLFLAAAASAASACSTAMEPVGQVEDSIDSYIRTLPYLPVDPAGTTPGAATPAQISGDYSCTTQNLSETKQYDSIVAYAANSDSLWPGALVDADSVLTGLFTQIVMPRAPATISIPFSQWRTISGISSGGSWRSTGRKTRMASPVA